MLLPSYKVSVLHWDKVGSSEKSLLILEVVFVEGSRLVLLLEYECILVALQEGMSLFIICAA